MTPNKLSNDEVETGLKKLTKWSRNSSGQLECKIMTKDFQEAMNVATKIALHAEKVNHHPQLVVDYSFVLLKLYTHSCNAITQKDMEFARWIEAEKMS